MVFRKCLAVGASAFLLCMPALAEEIVFQHDESVMIVRGRQSGDDARYEFLANGEYRLQCVALDAAGKPIAVETTYTNIGIIRFDDLALSSVDRVVCQRRD